MSAIPIGTKTCSIPLADEPQILSTQTGETWTVCSLQGARTLWLWGGASEWLKKPTLEQILRLNLAINQVEIPCAG